MPRLTNRDYLNQRAFLAVVWKRFPEFFTELRYSDQLTLHAFYHPSHVLDEAAALDKRSQATLMSASLPNRAGKLYQRLQRRVCGRSREQGRRGACRRRRRTTRASASPCTSTPKTETGEEPADSDSSAGQTGAEP